MTNITKQLAAACGYENVTPEVRRFQSSASNGLVLDAMAEIERLRADLAGALAREETLRNERDAARSCGRLISGGQSD